MKNIQHERNSNMKEDQEREKKLTSIASAVCAKIAVELSRELF